MLISNPHKFIFFKTMKTGGTSLEMAMQRYCVPVDYEPIGEQTPEIVTDQGVVGARGAPAQISGMAWRNHMSAAEIKAQIDCDTWRDWFKFTIVRNPFDKVVSNYYFNARHSPKASLRETINDFNDWVLKRTDEVYVDSDIYCIDGAAVVNSVIRYEAFEADFATVCAHVGVPRPTLGTYKGQMRKHRQTPLQDFYGADAMRKVEELFAFEINAFDYGMPK